MLDCLLMRLLEIKGPFVRETLKGPIFLKEPGKKNEY
jgi:hypothetical protein